MKFLEVRNVFFRSDTPACKLYKCAERGVEVRRRSPRESNARTP